MISPSTEKKLLQVVIGLACLVPVLAGLEGVLKGARLPGGGSIDLDSHFRYLSGLLLGAGLGFLSMIPHIERRTMYFRLLTLITVFGGSSRLLRFFLAGMPGAGMVAAAIMELIITPLICLWQHRVARRFSGREE